MSTCICSTDKYACPTHLNVYPKAEAPGYTYEPISESMNKEIDAVYGKLEFTVGGTDYFVAVSKERIEAIEKRVHRLYKFLGLGE